MTAHAITITYDDVACVYKVTCTGLGLTATGTTLESAMQWLVKQIRDSEE